MRTPGRFRNRGKDGPSSVPGALSAQPDAEAGAGLSNTIGIETKGGVFTALISRGTLLPASRTEIFTTADRDQTSIKITLFQGERALAKHNRRLGLFEISGLPPGPAGKPQIAVTFSVDESHAFNLTARDEKTGANMQVLQR
jgi:molecular chaperone DnaK